MYLPLFSFALLAAVIGGSFGVVSLIRRNRGLEETEPGIGVVRRLYFYGVSAVALMMAANGIVLVCEFILDSLFGPEVLTRSFVGLATGLSLTVAGLPLWAFYWWIIGRQVRDLPVEARSVLRKVYVYSVLGASLVLVMGGAVGILEWAFGTDRLTGWSWSAIAVFGAVWIYHWRTETAEGQRTPETLAVRRFYLYLASAVTLVLAAASTAQIIHGILFEAYENMTAAVVLRRLELGLGAHWLRESLPIVLVAAPVWAAHWLYFARGDIGSVLRQLYVNVLAVFGGIVTILTALGFLIHGTLVWLFGVPDEAFASSHFRFVPGALASIIVGSAVLVHHWLVSAGDVRTRDVQAAVVRRSYAYALAGIGLIVLASAVVTLVVTAVGLVESGGDVIAGSDAWRNALALGFTMAALGAPLWGGYWTWVQRGVAAGGPAERSALPRRILISAALGAGMLALLGGFSHLTFVLFREILDGDLAVVLGDAKGSIGVIAAAAVFLPYHWLVYRDDRRVLQREGGEGEKTPRKAVTVLISESGMAFVGEIEEVLGYRVSPLRWADPEAGALRVSGLELRELAQRIGDAPGRNVLLIPDESGVRVLSYR